MHKNANFESMCNHFGFNWDLFGFSECRSKYCKESTVRNGSAYENQFNFNRTLLEKSERNAPFVLFASNFWAFIVGRIKKVQTNTKRICGCWINEFFNHSISWIEVDANNANKYWCHHWKVLFIFLSIFSEALYKLPHSQDRPKPLYE